VVGKLFEAVWRREKAIPNPPNCIPTSTVALLLCSRPQPGIEHETNSLSLKKKRGFSSAKCSRATRRNGGVTSGRRRTTRGVANAPLNRNCSSSVSHLRLAAALFSLFLSFSFYATRTHNVFISQLSNKKQGRRRRGKRRKSAFFV